MRITRRLRHKTNKKHLQHKKLLSLTNTNKYNLLHEFSFALLGWLARCAGAGRGGSLHILFVGNLGIAIALHALDVKLGAVKWLNYYIMSLF